MSRCSFTMLLYLCATPLALVAGTTTSTSLLTSSLPGRFGANVTMTATVTPPGAVGKVTFYDSTTPLGTASLLMGSASFSTIVLASGNRRLTAIYNGDSSHTTSKSNAVLESVLSTAGNIFAKGPTPPVDPTRSQDSVLVGDFNHDGKADLVLASVFNGLTVLLGKGNGSFQVPILYPAVRAYALSSADLDGDGNPDLVVLQGSSVDVLLGNGDGTFKSPVHNAIPGMRSPLPTGGLDLAVSDFNGDGIVDVVLLLCGDLFCQTNPLVNNIAVLFGNGDGTFKPPITTSFFVPALPNLTAIGDFNGDGIPDLILGAYDGSRLCIQLGKGDGTFQAGTCYPPTNVTSVAVVDFNGDGTDDLIVGTQVPSAVSVYLGRKDGTFSITSPTPTTFPSHIATADFNGDGKIDLVISSRYGGLYDNGGITIIDGNGDGTLRSPNDYLSGGSAAFVAVGDWNGDGRADLVTVSDQVTVWLGVLASLTPSGGTPQSASPGQEFPSTLQVTVRDSDGNPVEGVNVTFTAATVGSSASLGYLAALTDAAGIAFTGAIANAVAGEYSVIASVGALNAKFSLTNSLDATGSFSLPSAAIAPNTIISAYGRFTGCTEPAHVFVGGVETEVFYSSTGQINFLIPPMVSGRFAVRLQIVCAGQTSLALYVPTVITSPSVFTIAQDGSGQASVVNQDGRVGAPSPSGTVVSVYVTGFGLLQTKGFDGLSRLVLPVTAAIGGDPADVLYAGATPGFTSGLQQINILIPPSVPSGSNIPLTLTVGGRNTQPGVVLAIE